MWTCSLNFEDIFGKFPEIMGKYSILDGKLDENLGSKGLNTVIVCYSFCLLLTWGRHLQFFSFFNSTHDMGNQFAMGIGL